MDIGIKNGLCFQYYEYKDKYLKEYQWNHIAFCDFLKDLNPFLIERDSEFHEGHGYQINLAA